MQWDEAAAGRPLATLLEPRATRLSELVCMRQLPLHAYVHGKYAHDATPKAPPAGLTSCAPGLG